MRLLLNENMPASLTRRLRDAGHDVVSVKEAMRGAADHEVLARAQAEQRILLTQDKDFGELAFRYGLPSACGVILFRVASPDPERTVERMHDVLSSRDDWDGHYAVATDDRVRMRSLQPKAES